MSYAGLGSAASYKRYWNQYASACTGMADEGACLNRAIQHGANVSFSGLGQTSDATSAMQIAANLTSIGAQIVANPTQFATTRAAPIVNMLDAAIVSPLVDRATQRATPYMVRYLLPPLTVLYVLSGLAAFYAFEGLKVAAGKKGLAPNRRRRHRRRRS